MLERLLGVGGFAAVYRAQCADGSHAAVKILTSDAPRAAKRFAREAAVMRSLPPSPHLVSYRGQGRTSDGSAFLAMEYVAGPTLSTVLKSRRRLPRDEACLVLYQVALALQSLHRYGIVHRDLKPNNLLIDPDGLVKLFDFGLVLDSQGLLRLFEQEDILSGDAFAENLEKGTVAGTPEYMAGEQFYGVFRRGVDRRGVGPEADVFSAGVILFRVLTGSLPLAFVRGPGRLDTKRVKQYLKERAQQIEFGLSRPEVIDEALWSIVMRTLSTDPTRRQPDSRALADDLYGYLTRGTGTCLFDEPSTLVSPALGPEFGDF